MIHTLPDNGAIGAITPVNAQYVVAASGFEGVTDPSFALTMNSEGVRGKVNASDIFVLDTRRIQIRSRSTAR